VPGCPPLGRPDSRSPERLACEENFLQRQAISEQAIQVPATMDIQGFFNVRFSPPSFMREERKKKMESRAAKAPRQMDGSRLLTPALALAPTVIVSRWSTVTSNAFPSA